MPKNYLQLAFEGSFIARVKNPTYLEVWRYGDKILMVNPTVELFVELD